MGAPEPVISPTRLVGLPPLVNTHTRVWVLGSFPGVASLEAQQYYGHPRNHFWPIMAHIFDALLASNACPISRDSYCSDYTQRTAWLLSHGVGLWDVYASCERQGSLDADIRHAVVNDFDTLRALCPQLRLVAHNGATSFRHHRHTLALGVPVVKLPSSSPANASWSLERKKAAWWAALGPALAG